MKTWELAGGVALGIVFARLWSQASSVSSASIAAYGCESVYSILESLGELGSPAQWMVALLGLCLYPALSRGGRAATVRGGGVGSATASAQDSTRTCGPGSHFIQLGRRGEDSSGQQRGSGSSGFWKRVRKVLADGRAQARRLYGRDSPLQGAVATLSRKRSFGSRSSNKSEDVLSSRLSMDSMLRATQQNAGGSGRRSGGGGLLQRKGSWKPSMRRIESGQHLAGCAASDSSMSSVATGKRLEILMHNGFLAVDCMAHEITDPAFEGVRQVVTDTHLLQFGALIGEASSELALSQSGGVGAVGPDPACLFGPVDRKENYQQGWELLEEARRPGLHYYVWRRYLRKGLYMYKSKTVYETATTAQITSFTYDMEFRRTWDENMACQLPIPPPPHALVADGSEAELAMTVAQAGGKASGGRSAFMYARTKFPPPMASRVYTYVRRCWAKPDDGGCYCISRVCAHPSPPAASGRTVRVTDFVSGYVIRSSKGVFDTANPAVEVVNVYFEDPAVPSGIANMGIRRALLPMVQKTEAAFRDFLLTRVHGGLEQPEPERAVALDSLGVAMGAAGAQAARAAADADAASCIDELGASGGRLLRLLRLGSPYVLLYRGYMGVWRGGRGALLSGLSCCMSLWCNATCGFVGALGVARSALHAAASGVRGVLVALTQPLTAVKARSNKLGSAAGSRVQNAGRIITRVLWPWETLFGRNRSAQNAYGTSTASSLQRTTSGGSGGGDRLASHPLPLPGVAKRLAFDPRTSGGTPSADGALSPRGGRRVRGSLGRFFLKVVKVAGAGLLLGRAARSDGGAEEPATPQGGRQQQATQGQGQQRQAQPQYQQSQQRPPPPMRRVAPSQDW